MLGESSRLGFKFPPFVWFFGQVTKIVFLTYNETAKPHLKLVPEDFVRRHADDLLPRFLLLTKQMVNVLHSAPLPGVSDGVLPENHHLPEGETCSYRFFTVTFHMSTWYPCTPYRVFLGNLSVS